MRFTLACLSTAALLATTGCSQDAVVAQANAVTTPALEETAPAVEPDFVVALTGAAQVPGPGDSDGSGTARITIDEANGEICYDLALEGVDEVVQANIASGAAGASGTVAVPFAAGMEGWKGCTMVSRAMLHGIETSPADYHLNVHTEGFPAGALRGQLAQ